MTLTSQMVVKFSSECYPLLDEFCFKAKNFHNVTLYRIREAYFEYDAQMPMALCK